MAESHPVFTDRNILQTSIGKVEYDYPVPATGTTSYFFGNKHIEEEAIPMKTLEEAMGLRNALLGNFERSVTCTTEQERQELLNIVIVEGGATERLSGHGQQPIADLPARSYRPPVVGHVGGFFREVERVSLRHGVNVCLGKKVSDYQDHKVILEDGSTIHTRTFIWVSGVCANTVGNLPETSIGRGRRLKVDAYNRVEGFSNIFSIGDQCIMNGGDPTYPNGHPQLAQVAIQQGKLLADNLKRLEQGVALKPFRYRNLGSMATVGRNKAVAEFSSMKIQGWTAWFLWLVVHLRSILGVRNKINVLFNWMWSYLTYDHSLRLILYARKAKEVIDREKREAEVHWGENETLIKPQD